MLAILSFFIMEDPESELVKVVDMLVPGKKMMNVRWQSTKAEALHLPCGSCRGEDGWLWEGASRLTSGGKQNSLL